MEQLATSFHQYGAWRDALAVSILQLLRWLEQSQLLDAEAARRLGLALERLDEDKLVIAFVAEFSRGKSELINAIFFADYGRRILPSSAGRTSGSRAPANTGVSAPTSSTRFNALRKVCSMPTLPAVMVNASTWVPGCA